MFTIILYRLLFWPIFLLVMPYYAYRMKRRGGYGKDFKFRFGLFKKLPKRKFGKKRLWIQAVSVGEIKALEKLINLLIESNLYEIVLTTTTSTGYEVARDLYKDKILFIGLFPFDFWVFSWLAWKKIFPHMAILMENEIWPEHIWQATKREVPVVIINGRISDRTFSHYKILKNLAEPILKNISYILSSDQISEDRLREMGIEPSKIKISGNMKFDNVVAKLSDEKVAELKQSLGFSADDLILLGSSTWEGEELMLLKTIKQCQKCDKRWKLLLVPRHAERRNKIVSLLQRSELSWHQRSTGNAKKHVDVCLADTTGELPVLTAISDLAFIGKSISPNNGGQSPLDAAYRGVPIVYGNKMTNFRDICSSLEGSKCVIKVDSSERAMIALETLARDEDKRNEFSKRLMDWHKNNTGASEFVCKKIQEIAFRDQ